MQMTMTLEACSRCGQPIAPGEPAMQTASVDLDIYGRAVSSPVRSYHLTGRCYEDAQGSRSCPQGGPESRLGGSHPTASHEAPSHSTPRMDCGASLREPDTPTPTKEGDTI